MTYFNPLSSDLRGKVRDELCPWRSKVGWAMEDTPGSRDSKKDEFCKHLLSAQNTSAERMLSSTDGEQ